MNQAHMALIGSSWSTGFTIGQNAKSSSRGLDEHGLSNRRDLLITSNVLDFNLSGVLIIQIIKIKMGNIST